MKLPVTIKNTEHLTPQQRETLIFALEAKLSQAVFETLLEVNPPKPPGTPPGAGGFLWNIQTWGTGL
jgi:hypothetical protein